MASPLLTWPVVRQAVAERCRPREAPEGWNPFGVPAGLVGWVELLDELGMGAGPRDHDDAALGAALSQIGHDLRLVEATGRWTITRAPRRTPSSYVPGDALALRTLYGMDLMMDADPVEVAAVGDSGIKLRRDALPVAHALVEAEAYWLPPGSEEAVLASEAPPADQLASARLRRPVVVVWLAHPAEIPPGAAPAGLLDDMVADVGQFGTEELQMPAPLLSAATMLDSLVDDPRKAQLEGLMLFADADGVLGDGLAWLVQVPSVVDRAPLRGVVLGRRSQAGWRAVAEMLAAIVAWGDWKLPPSIPVAAEPGRADLRRLRQGSTRRLEEAGALAGVRVLDARRRAPARSEEASGTHASPIPHPRRGYWRNQPVGPRDDGRRELRWIPPTWVNAGGRRPPLRVYRLPAAPKPAGAAAGSMGPG
ncbi:MAG TPA: hypothetical protein VFJ85_01285 [Acidimicrobiales bacterium]|nr:hypothetical protein [Acidimicrobiales bacterium]